MPNAAHDSFVASVNVSRTGGGARAQSWAFRLAVKGSGSQTRRLATRLHTHAVPHYGQVQWESGTLLQFRVQTNRSIILNGLRLRQDLGLMGV